MTQISGCSRATSVMPRGHRGHFFPELKTLELDWIYLHRVEGEENTSTPSMTRTGRLLTELSSMASLMSPDTVRVHGLLVGLEGMRTTSKTYKVLTAVWPDVMVQTASARVVNLTARETSDRYLGRKLVQFVDVSESSFDREVATRRKVPLKKHLCDRYTVKPYRGEEELEVETYAGGIIETPLPLLVLHGDRHEVLEEIKNQMDDRLLTEYPSTPAPFDVTVPLPTQT